MSNYGDEEMYEVPEPIFSHKRQYGAGPTGAPAKKRKTAAAMADKKGSSKTTGIRSSEFRYASVHKALNAIGEEVGTTRRLSWSKAAVLMIASALEYKL